LRVCVLGLLFLRLLPDIFIDVESWGFGGGGLLRFLSLFFPPSPFCFFFLLRSLPSQALPTSSLHPNEPRTFIRIWYSPSPPPPLLITPTTPPLLLIPCSLPEPSRLLVRCRAFHPACITPFSPSLCFLSSLFPYGYTVVPHCTHTPLYSVLPPSTLLFCTFGQPNSSICRSTYSFFWNSE